MRNVWREPQLSLLAFCVSLVCCVTVAMVAGSLDWWVKLVKPGYYSPVIYSVIWCKLEVLFPADPVQVWFALISTMPKYIIHSDVTLFCESKDLSFLNSTFIIIYVKVYPVVSEAFELGWGWFMRVILIPNMQHCQRGAATSISQTSYIATIVSLCRRRLTEILPF